MENFFYNIIHGPIAIRADKMYEISQIINAREGSSSVSLFTFIKLFADRIDELREVENYYRSCCSHNREDAQDALELSNIKIGVCISVLVNFFYPIIEQLETIVDDGITLEKDVDKTI